eukprot:s786_g11.t2
MWNAEERQPAQRVLLGPGSGASDLVNAPGAVIGSFLAMDNSGAKPHGLNGRRQISFSREMKAVVDPPGLNEMQRGSPNRIRTTRFTWLTWLPKSLFAQFHRAANVYFLFVSIIVCLPDGPMMWSSTVVPFIGVLLWTAFKDLYEDRRRKKDDDAENLRTCWRYDTKTKEFAQVRWMDVCVGDILLSFADEAFPADVLVVRAAGGQAFISTVNLDGETNLKERNSANLLSALCDMPEAGPDVPRGENARGEVLVSDAVRIEKSASLLLPMHPYSLHIHERPLTLIKFNYDGDFFLTCGKDGEVNLIRTETCERMGTYNPPGEKGGAIYAVDVTMDSTFVVTANADGKVVFYNFQGDMVQTIQHGGVLKYVEWNMKPGEQNYVCTCLGVRWCTLICSIEVSIFEEGTVIIWDVVDGRQLKLIQAHQMAITSMNFTEDRMMMATCSKEGSECNWHTSCFCQDGTAKLWTMDDYECMKEYKTDRPLNDVAISPLYCHEATPKMHLLMGGGQDAKDVAVSGSSGAFEALLWHVVYEEEIGSAVQTAQHLYTEGLQVELQAPKPVLTDMEGSLNLSSASETASAKLKELEVTLPCKLSYELFVPRGCVLRNTLYVISVAAFTGPQTKTRLNAAEAVGKVSNMQVYLNRGVQGLVAALLLWCIYCATSAEIQGVSKEDGRNWGLRFLFYWIILYQIIPISLYVFFEIVKLILGVQINRDPQMRDPRTKLGAMARTADLVEEMGQVNFVFSDKTGTLTENEMVFAHCCVCHEDDDARELGDFRQTAKLVEKSEDAPGICEGKKVLSSPEDPRYKEVLWFFMNLAANHSVQVEGEGIEKKFEGSSADEVAFVEAAQAVGVTFFSRTRIPGTSSSEVVVKGPGSKDFTFTILGEIPFSSDRKRMSVIVKHEGEYWCLCKGADNIMGPLCDRPLGGSLGLSLTHYSKLGLRTLVIASKKLNDHEFVEDWLARWKEATVAEDREREMARVAAEVEHSLRPAGVTAIEDKLQDGVPEAIVSVKAAGIRFWVLTGDKTETAVEIAKACKLFTENTTLAYLVNCSSESQALQLIEEAKKTIEGKSDGGLVLDGTFVQQILTSKDGRPMLYELAISSQTCVCCRLSPQQKRRLVEMVKDMNRELPANPFAKYRGETGKRLRLGSHWVQSPQIQGELEAMKSKVMQMLMVQQKKESPKTSLPRFNPPSRELHQVTKVEAQESNPRPQDVSVLSFDQSSGLLFQLPLSENAMIFTATEIGTALRCIAGLPKRFSNVAFSLDPVDPKSWNSGTSKSQLYQRKWYSQGTLDEIPLGYWMWRADWKLKQLAQGVVYDDATGQQRPLKLGVDVPLDFPDVAQGDTGCARLWIVCRKMVRMPWGKDTILIHPEVQMGVEVRAQQFNKLTGKYEDAPEAPHSSASRIAQYLSRHYDIVARFVPELQHCKRMAVLLDVVHWLLEGPLHSKKLMLDQCIPRYTIPQDFPADRVPALRTVHEKGLQEEAKVKKMDQELEISKAQFKQRCAKEEERIQSLRSASEKQMKKVEAAKKTLDQYSSKSVEACNLEVQKYNALVEDHRSAVESYNAAVAEGNGKLNAIVKERNAAAAACNAVRSSFVFVGGVDLAAAESQMRPVNCEAQPVQAQFRQWAKGLWSNNESRSILGRFQQKAPSLEHGKVSLLQEVLEEQNAALSVFQLTAPAA